MNYTHSIKTVDINPDGSLLVAVCCKSSPLDPENYPAVGTWNPYTKAWDNTRSDPFQSTNKETHQTPKKTETPKKKISFSEFLKSLK